MELRRLALQALCAADPREKVALVTALRAQAGQLPLYPTAPLPPTLLPGPPLRPHLIHAAKVPRRSPGTAEGVAPLLHAIARIDLKARGKAHHSSPSHIAEPRETTG